MVGVFILLYYNQYAIILNLIFSNKKEKDTFLILFFINSLELNSLSSFTFMYKYMLFFLDLLVILGLKSFIYIFFL